MFGKRLLLVAILIVLAACAGDTPTGPFDDEPSGIYMRALIGDAQWEAGTWQHWPVVGIYHTEPEQVFFAIEGVGVVGEDRWEIGLYIPASEGTHSLALTANSGFAVYQVLGGAEDGYAGIHYDPDSLDPGTVVLTRWDMERHVIEGSFSLSGHANGSDERVTMTAGRFRVHYDGPDMSPP
jgi:hypothetical protein